MLKAALEAQVEGKFLVTGGTDFESAGFQGRAGVESDVCYQEECIPTMRASIMPNVMQFVGADVYNGQITGDTSATLTANGGSSPTHSGPTVIQAEILDMTHANDVIRECGDTCPTLQARMGTGGNQIPLVFEPTYCIQGNTIDRSDTAGANGKGVVEGESYTLNTVDRHAVCHSIGFCPNNISTAAGLSEVDEKSPTLSTTKNVATCYPINTQVVTRYNKLGEGTGMGIGDDGDPAYTLQAVRSHGVIYAIDRAAFNQGENAKYNFQIENDGVNSTIVARGPSAVLDCRLAVWIVRRLTPRECERLQGFPDDWTMYDASGNELKDTPRYKALGNSIAIPCALRVFQGIVGTEAAS